MRWLIGSWLLVTAVCGLTTVQAASDEASSWQLAPPVSPVRTLVTNKAASPNLTTTVAKASDICAPCDYGDQCSSGLCAIAQASTVGICSQKCTPSATNACPTGFTCKTPDPNDSTVSSCIPNDTTVCPVNYFGAQLNDICTFPPSAIDNPNASFSRDCADGLACLTFPVSGIGACLNKCSSIDPNFLCNPNQKCCFGLDANGYCMSSTANNKLGGCIQIQSVGDSCVDADASVCIQGAICANSGYDATSKCYTNCATDPSVCPVGATCATVSGLSLCCDANQYNSDDQTTCFPVQAACKLLVGVACTSDVDCKTSQCKSYGGAKACASPCQTDADCPSDTADVNFDGVPDGGSQCITLGNGNYCWPKTTPATQPPCFSIPSQEASPGSAQGCTCQGGPGAPVWCLALLICASCRLWRRRAP